MNQLRIHHLETLKKEIQEIRKDCTYDRLKRLCMQLEILLDLLLRNEI